MFEDTIGLPLLTESHAAVLRCYLAVGDLAAYALHQDWLSTEHLVESARVWLVRNACAATWLERVNIVAEACNIAQSVIRCEPASGNGGSADQLFNADLTVNFASPLVARVWRRCNGEDAA